MAQNLCWEHQKSLYLVCRIHYIFLFIARQPFDVPPLTGQDLFYTCITSTLTSSGMDHWSPGEFKLLSLIACDYLAMLLRLIEGGAPWPCDLVHAKGSFLSKGPCNPHDPLSYRILLLLPVLYRKWASTSLLVHTCSKNAPNEYSLFGLRRLRLR